MKKDKYLVTSALTYANGDLHIGHIAGSYLNADVFVRFQKLLGNDVIYIGGTDDYGTPISLKAEEEKVHPQKIVDRYNLNMQKDLRGLNIKLDNFSGTSHQEHTVDSQDFFFNLQQAGYIFEKEIEQFFDPVQKRFLSDRYVEGICPHCKSEGARGDQCDACGKLLDAMDLIEPKSRLSGEKPIIKKTKHWYLDLPKFENKLRNWLETKDYWKDNVRNFIMGWLNEGLKERAITRDLNWGVPLPLENTQGKVLYVWFDAPIGYLTSTKEWAKKSGEPDKWKNYWLDPKTKMIHFLGKDNIPFHTMIWPAMLMEQKEKFVLPYDVPANEYLNLEGKKMSTSRNWTVWVKDFLKHFDGEYLRYVLAINAPETKDSDFSWKDFQMRINGELNNVLGNLANRTFVFTQKYFAGKITKPTSFSRLSQKIFAEIRQSAAEIKKCYQNYQVRKATKLFMDLARSGNRYFDESKPWETVTDHKDRAEETLYVCSQILQAISILASPVIPESMKKLRKMLGIIANCNWNDIQTGKEEFRIQNVEKLYRKIEDKEIIQQYELLEKNQIRTEIANEHKEKITFDEFLKMELRLVKILSAEKIKKSKKLLKLIIDVGNEKRSVVAGISEYYEPKEIIGKKVPMVINLQPRKVMGVESQAMILAVKDKNEMALLFPDKDLRAGSEIS